MGTALDGQAILSSKYLKHLDLSVDLRFICAALLSQR